MLSAQDQIALARLESAYLDPPDVDEILPYEDWWYTLEDINYESMREDTILCRD